MRECVGVSGERIAVEARKGGRLRRPGARNESGKTHSPLAEARLETDEDQQLGSSWGAAAEVAHRWSRHLRGRADQEPAARSRRRGPQGLLPNDHLYPVPVLARSLASDSPRSWLVNIDDYPYSGKSFDVEGHSCPSPNPTRGCVHPDLSRWRQEPSKGEGERRPNPLPQGERIRKHIYNVLHLASSVPGEVGMELNRARE